MAIAGVLGAFVGVFFAFVRQWWADGPASSESAAGTLAARENG